MKHTQTIQTRPAAPAGKRFLADLKHAAGCALAHFPAALKRSLLVLLVILLLGALRVALNMQFGISFANALRPMLIGFFFAAFQIILIDMIYFMLISGHQHSPARAEVPASRVLQPKKHPAVLVFLLVIWVFWLLEIIDHLQTNGALAGTPLLNVLPGWQMLKAFILSAGTALHDWMPILPVESAAVLVSSLVLRIAFPFLILGLMGFKPCSRALTFRRWQNAAPFILIGLAAFAAGGLSERKLALLGVGLLYPALTEELFYRGWMQRALQGWTRPGYSVLISAVFFGLLHLPSFAAVQYEGMFPLALTNVIDVTITGMVWGYGVLRTRSVLPWTVFHAVSNSAGF